MAAGDPQAPAAGISTPRRIAYWAILFALSIVAPLCAVEALLRQWGPRVADDPYLSLGRVPMFFAEGKIDGKSYYHMTNWETYPARNVVFSRQKDPHTFRIFCLGGSASAGWPHPASEAYSAYLQQALQGAFPDRTIEVINASAHAYAAYRIRFIFEEVINHDPDLIILYTGSNEFLEKRTYSDGASWFAPLSAGLNHLVTFRLLRGSGLARWLFPENTLWGAHRDHVTYAEWSKLEQLALRLRSDPQQFQHVKEHFAFSVESMVSTAQRRHVPVILVNEPVNLREWHPNVSYQALAGAELTAWQAQFATGRAALLSDDPAAAVRALQAATALAPLHGDSHFYLARALERAGDFDVATAEYSRARDLDYNPFRNLSDFNLILMDIAQRHDNVSLVDAQAACGAATAPFAPGFDLFLDYVHPTQRGNLVIAESVFNAVRTILAGPSASQRFAYTPPPSGADGTPYDEGRDFKLHCTLVRLSVMMHQDERALQEAQYLAATSGALNDVRPPDRQLVGAVLDLFPELIDAERQRALGMPLGPDADEQLTSRLNEFYRAQYPGYDAFQRGYTVDHGTL